MIHVAWDTRHIDKYGIFSFSSPQVGIRSINYEGREQGKKFGVEQYEMRTFSKDRDFLENLVSLSVHNDIMSLPICII